MEESVAINMGLITAPRICGSNLRHTSEFTPKDLCHMVVHALCAWMTLLFVGVSCELSMYSAYGRLLLFI